MIDNSIAEVFPCRCGSEYCDYKKQWEDAGSPLRISVEVAIGTQYMPLVYKWLITKYCNRKGEQAQLIH